MNQQVPRGERGQALVTVTIALLVLLLFAALAVDVGQMYTQRRHMQNAADAGALAGARQMCLGETDTITSTAESYAQGNGSPIVTSTIDSNIVIVTATIPVTSFLAQLIGIHTTPVHAVARAACGEATRGCGIFPLTIDAENYAAVPCGQKFVLFEESNFSTEPGLCDNCDCGTEYYYSGNMQIGPGDRGWLRLPDPSDTGNYPDPNSCGSNCGSALKCWVQYDWPGQVSIGECIPGKGGTDESANKAAKKYRIGQIVRIPIYDIGTCTSVIGTCPGDNYRVAEFGCVQIEAVYESSDHFDLLPRTVALPAPHPTPNPGYQCPGANIKAIIATKLCDCDMTACGATSGTPVPEAGVGAVSLVD